MDDKKDEIYNKISESLEEREGRERRNEPAVAEYINPDLDRRKLKRRTISSS